MLKYFVFSIFVLINIVVGDVSLSKPQAGKTFTVSGSSISIDLAWIDDGTSPEISTITGLTFTLCTGPNTDIQAVADLASNKIVKTEKITLSIPATAGANGVYYIQVYAVYPEGSTIHYTNRFKLTGMTGSTKPSGSLSDMAPSAQISIKEATDTLIDVTATMDVSASFLIPYNSQTGIYKFAPMQLQPGSVVTATEWSMQYPTSSVSYYSTHKATPAQKSTITPGWSYIRTSLVNDASALGTPSGGYAATAQARQVPMKHNSINSNSNVKRFLSID